MAVGTVTIYRKNLDVLNMADLLGATVKMALVKSTYTPDFTNTGDSVWADISADEIANGNGYTTGGQALTTDVATAVTDGFKYSSDSPVWNATPSDIPVWRYAVMYVEGSLWGVTNPLVCAFLGDTTPADVPATSAGNPLTINTPTDGWFDTTQP
ncbi:hypothetical protein [Candidatus Nitrotoga sp. M5]|uniref:hypothetical protein n=1 Tax=Candidatus Nitrotoga sp. M5 TaxID=2890409 RepID=UPI001EF6DF2C|nr:hypothetical protein [Candidatus Nitrotoga sp. M5]CAH1387024.1 conserved hypothetical protein [Candidatus Nitrotoga sp. M5]